MRISTSNASVAKAATSCAAAFPWRHSVPSRRQGTMQKRARLPFTPIPKRHQSLIARYTRGEIDAVYILFNEFKSVIAQRLVAERLLPIKEIGEVDVQMAEEPSEEERKKRIEAAKSAGVGLRR